MPLDTALHLARALVQAVSDHHEAQQAIGPFDSSSVSVDGLGHVVVKRAPHAAAAPELAAGAEPDLLSDLYSLGAVFYRLFSGLSPVEAARRSHGHLPPPSRFNPAVDEALDGLVLTMLDADPIQRPYRLAQVDGQLVALSAELGIDADPNALLRWVASHRPAVVAPKAPAPVGGTRPLGPVRWQLEADDEADEAVVHDEAWEGPVRFDVWAAASAGVVALGAVLIALI
ncbi:MAG: hypothetical protein SFW67_04330 [Myxococcaceae bacterium]|nr:hypothetical protein [Myxococcaceae bacterium]